MDENIPTEEEITALLNRVQPHPGAGFKQRMATQPWRRKDRAPFWASLTPTRVAASFGLIFLLIFGISFFSPSVNTLAQRFSQFFQSSTSSRSINETFLLETRQPLDRFNLTIFEAETLAGFKMKTPAHIPQELKLVGATFDDLREAIILHYATETNKIVLRISQQHLDPDYQSIGPEAVVETVEIGTQIGEFVVGGWNDS